MNLLLDTHTLLWLMQASPRLSGTAAALVTDPANRVHLSMATAWEVAIKVGMGKMGLTVPYTAFFAKAIAGYSLSVVPITLNDCAAYESLPFPNPNHHDPFDRMIITHARLHGLSVVGADAAFDAYGVVRLW